jgi:hypothetical protein
VRTKVIGVGLVGVLTLATGCGGGGARLSAHEYVKASSAVCARANRAVDRVHVPDLGSSENARRAMGRVVAIHRASVDSLRDLRPPKDYEHTAKVWIALVDQALDELDGMRGALRAGDRRMAISYANKATTLDERSQAIAREHNITPCRVPTLTA